MKQKQKLYKRTLKTAHGMTVLFVTAVLAFAAVVIPVVRADRFDDQINKLENQNSSSQDELEELTAKARSLEDVIAKLQQQVDGLQREIEKNQKRSAKLQVKITKTEIQLAKQRDLLGENIKAMYLEGQITTLEMLATSKDLSEFVDKQQYREVVKAKIKGQVDAITELKLELKAQRDEVERLIKEDEELRRKINAQRAERARLLNLNEAEQAAFNKRISKNNKRIADLRMQQALENIRLFGGTGGQIGGGGYPWGRAKCIHTGRVEGSCYNYDWSVGGSVWNYQSYGSFYGGGYGFRNCTDWVAWRVHSATSGRKRVPSGMGDATYWDDRATSKGFRVSSNVTPSSWRPGIAAVSNSNSQPIGYGHVMYVEAAHADGTITVSDYNRAGTGKYDITRVPKGSLVFVYF